MKFGRNFIFMISILLVYIVSWPLAMAINIDGSGDTNGVQALYIFKNYRAVDGVVPDTSGVGAALDLQIDNKNSVALSTDKTGNVGLTFKSVAVLRSKIAATKIINACGTNNAITVDVWVRNLSEEPVGRQQPVRLVALGRKNADDPAKITHKDLIYLGQKYDGLGLYAFETLGRTPSSILSKDVPNTLLFGSQMPPQRIVYTKDSDGVARLWLSNPVSMLMKQDEKTQVGDILDWPLDPKKDQYFLSLGNEPFYSDFPEYGPGAVPGNEWKSWLGTLYALAISCRAVTPTELLGDSAPGASPLPVYPVDPNDVITEARRKAHTLYKRIVGITTPIDNPVVKQMAALIQGGETLQAALLATKENQFLNITIRDMAARMSTRDETANTSLNDMVATIIGVARDNLSAQTLLTGNFSYRADTTLAAVPNSEISDFLLSNNHYQALEDGRYDLAKVLRKVEGQKLYNGATGSVVSHPDPAGVITSRAFMAAHAIAGTNRRLVEYTFREFLCIPINQWADVSGTDTYVGRDVDRAPGNDHNKYKTTCRSCHSVMDSFRSAFAKVDFSANYVKHADVMFGLTSMDENGNSKAEVLYQSPLGIAGKMNRNPATFPDGNAVNDTAWENNAIRGLNAIYFGWPDIPSGQSTHRGFGIRSFASLVSQAKAFPRCMVVRAYRSSCKREPGANEQNMISRVADEFVQKNYNLRELFARVVITPECIGGN